jgi:hypothetical protein
MPEVPYEDLKWSAPTPRGGREEPRGGLAGPRGGAIRPRGGREAPPIPNQCTYESEEDGQCISEGDCTFNGKSLCRPHMLVRMATAGRPKCTFESEAVPLGSCRGHVYDGRDPEHARCKEHGGL